jgi:hypothetical protein
MEKPITLEKRNKSFIMIQEVKIEFKYNRREMT